MSESPTVRSVALRREALGPELLRLGADSREELHFLAQEDRAAFLFDGLSTGDLQALTGTARIHRLRIVTGGRSALVAGPVILLEEIGQDLPPSLAAAFRAAIAPHLPSGLGLGELLRHRTGWLDLKTPKIMGVVNVTPDSFSDGGDHFDPAAAIAHGERLAEQGAAILDVGGESTRPGAAPVAIEEELRRVVPVIEGLTASAAPQGGDRVVSIDTRHAEVAEAALEAGASIVNDVSGLTDAALRRVVRERDAGAVIMHMQGAPETMQNDPSYDDAITSVVTFLAAQADLAIEEGLPRGAIAIDPGIGFGKRLEDNLALLSARGMARLTRLGFPVLIGLSRKSMLGALLDGRPPKGRVAASVAGALVSISRGAKLIRVHDVEETADAFAVLRALEGQVGVPRA